MQIVGQDSVQINTPEPNDTIYVDSTFATVSRRSRVIEIAKTAGVRVSAVWVKVGLATALRRNKRRPADEIVSDDAIENVFRIFEPPSLDEGFHEVIIVSDDSDCVQQPCGRITAH